MLAPGLIHCHAMEDRMVNVTRLNSAMPAVDVFLEVDGCPVKAIIPREVFERCLGSAPTPSAWLQAYHENASTLDRVIHRRYAALPSDTVVVRSGDIARPVRRARASDVRQPTDPGRC
jgi:hypothetical protein